MLYPAEVGRARLGHAVVGLLVVFASAPALFAADAPVADTPVADTPVVGGAVNDSATPVATTIDDAVVGQYLEARTCDVWTGPCFANGEINLRGEHAVMAWAVQRGKVGGVSLAGLRIVAVLDADGTLHTSSQGKVRSALYIDAEASPKQAQALRAMAVRLAPTHLGNIVHEEQAAIRYQREGQNVTLEVGEKVRLKTKALKAHCDIICGNEEKAYPALSENAYVSCAKAVAHAYKGNAFKARWSEPETRSAMVGSFAL